MKKSYFTFLCLALLTLASQTAWADTDYYSGFCGPIDNEQTIAWTLNAKTGEMMLIGSGPMKDYAFSNSVPWHYQRDKIKKVVIGSGITSITEFAFIACDNLTEVTIPSSMTTIGKDAFYDCPKLIDITIPYGVTTIEEGAFKNCDNLTDVTIPSSVTNIGMYAFSGCDNLITASIPGSLPVMPTGLFNECNNLASVTIEEGVPNIACCAFRFCKSLTSITIPESVLSIQESAFQASGLISVTIPEKVKTIGKYAFSGCNDLKKVMISEGVTTIEYQAFYGCDRLREVIIPTTMKSIANYAFFHGVEADIYCYALVPPTAAPYVFPAQPKGTLHVPEGKASAYRAADAWKNFTNIVDDATSNHSFINWDFNSQNGVLTISGEGNIQNYVVRSGKPITPWSNHIDDIREININTGVTSIGNKTFYKSTNLTSVTLPNTLTSMGDGAFEYCSSLSSITLPNTLTSIGDYAFSHCESLPSVSIPSSTKSIGGDAFSHCSSLTAVTIPRGVTSLGNRAFEYCTALKSVSIPSSIKSIPTQAFSSCTSLEEVVIANGVTSIGLSAFLGCSNMTDITIPGSVTSIGNSAFSGCSSLTSVKIPGGVTHISTNTFQNCTSLNDIYCYSDIPPTVASNAFSGVPSTATLHVPVGTGTAYQGASVWKEFNIVEDTYWYFRSNAGMLTITGDGAMTSAMGAYSDTNYAPWYEYADLIKSIVINSGVTYIGQRAFYGLDQMTSVSIPEGVSVIYNNAFLGCSSLTSVLIPSTVYNIGDYAFRNCTNLAEVTMQDATPCTITTHTFYNCPSLKIYVPVSSSSTYKSATGWSSYASKIVEQSTVSGTDGNITWLLENGTGVLTLRGTGPMNDYAVGSSPWYTYKDNIKSIIIGYGVTSIGSSAFVDCSNLTSVTIPVDVTSIGGGAFSGCSSLTNVTIPKGVTSIEGHTFYDCSSLTSMTIPEGVTTIKEYAFYGCSSMTSVNIPEGVTTIEGHTFQNCSSLASVDIPDGVTSIGNYAFSDCSSLKNLTISERVTYIGSLAFSSCTGLTDIYCFGWDTTSLPTANAFTFVYKDSSDKYVGLNATLHVPAGTKTAYEGAAGWSKITTIVDDLPAPAGDLQWTFDHTTSQLTISGTGNMDDYAAADRLTTAPWSAYATAITSIVIEPGVTGIGAKAFLGLQGVTSVTIPESVTTIGEGVFYECTRLTNVVIPNSVTHIGEHAFNGCSALLSITIPEGVTSINNNTFYGCGRLNSVTIPESVTSIGDSAFRGCASLTNVTIPEDVTTIGQRAFYGCTNLAQVTMENLAPCTLGTEVFDNCSSLLKIYVPYGTAATYKAAENWSAYEDKIVELTYASGRDGNITWHFDSTTGQLTISGTGEMPDYGAKSRLTTAPWSAYVTAIRSIVIEPGVTSIGVYAFLSLYRTTSVTIPETVTSIGGYAFYNLVNMTNVTIPASVKNISQGAFGYCTTLTSVTIPAGVTSIEDRTFDYCQKLTSVTIPESVTNIGDEVFKDCISLTNVTIPKNVTKIGKNVFYGCNALTDIYCWAETRPSVFTNTFDGVPSNVILHVPASSKTDYMAGWQKINFIASEYYKAKASAAADETSVEIVTDRQTDVNTITFTDGGYLLTSASDFEEPAEGVTVNYVRNFANTKWQALYVPFDIPVTDDLLAQFEFAKINDTHQSQNGEKTEIEFFTVEVGEVVKANTPYLVKAKSTGQQTMTVPNTTVYLTEEKSIDCSTTELLFTFTGIYTQRTSAEEQLAQCYAMAGGGLAQAEDGYTVTLSPYRFYMVVTNRFSDERVNLSISLRINGDDETTVIDMIPLSDSRTTEGEVLYDLSGRQITNPAEGIYIKNGKKYIQK